MDRFHETLASLKRSNELLGLLMDDLAELLPDSDDPENAGWILQVVEKMRENLQTQFELEEQHDYLAEVLERYPSWYPQVHHLQQEHRLLERHLDQALDRLQDEIDGKGLSRESRRQLTDWLDAFRNHDRRERNLLQEAFTLEVGVGE